MIIQEWAVIRIKIILSIYKVWAWGRRICNKGQWYLRRTLATCHLAGGVKITLAISYCNSCISSYTILTLLHLFVCLFVCFYSFGYFFLISRMFETKHANVPCKWLLLIHWLTPLIITLQAWGGFGFGKKIKLAANSLHSHYYRTVLGAKEVTLRCENVQKILWKRRPKNIIFLS